MGEKKSAVMDGRDIASNVFPNAAYKFFLTASPGERARRRYAELKAKGEDITPEAVYADIERRDYDDSHRSLNPLVKVEDAVEIDTGGLSPGEVTEKLMEYIRKRPAPAEHAFER
jgi:cytidylate kinase